MKQRGFISFSFNFDLKHQCEYEKTYILIIMFGFVFLHLAFSSSSQYLDDVKHNYMHIHRLLNVVFRSAKDVDVILNYSK